MTKTSVLIIMLALLLLTTLMVGAFICDVIAIDVMRSAYCYMPTHCMLIKKVFPYSLPSVGPGADSGVQAVSPQVT